MKIYLEAVIVGAGVLGSICYWCRCTWEHLLLVQVYLEVLQHLHLAHERCNKFRGREDILMKIKDNLLNSNGQPIILYGHSGCGKTSLMAKTAQMVFMLNGRIIGILYYGDIYFIFHFYTIDVVYLTQSWDNIWIFDK